MFEVLDIFAVVLFFISFLGLITARNVIKSIIFTLLMQTAVIMFWLFLGGRHGTRPPIIDDLAYLDNLYAISDPLPQTLMLTAIIIGISVTAINITMLNSLFRKYNTTDWEVMFNMAREEGSRTDGVFIASVDVSPDERQEGRDLE